VYIVGIDIAKHTHWASVLNEKGELVGKSFKLSNTQEGFKGCIAKLKAIDSDLTQFEFGMEATGHYWLNLYTHLTDLGCVVHVINPVQSDALRGLYIRQTKNDIRDSVIIADVIRIGRYSETAIENPDLLALRDLTRQRFYLVDMISDLKRKVLTLLDRVFPEYPTLFSDTFGKTSLELLSTYTTPEEILAVDMDKLCEVLNTASRGRFNRQKAERVKDTAANSFGALLCTDSTTFMLRQFVEQIKFLENQLSELENMISERLASFDTQITSITGIGNVLGASILSEIGDINRFESPEKLAAFAGIDPSVKQSGQFMGNQNHMSKRGSPYLRRAIWLAATAAILHDPALRAFYDKKRAEGKHHFTAVGYICHKMTNIIFAILKSNQPYRPVFPQSFA
jgi:transposase